MKKLSSLFILLVLSVSLFAEGSDSNNSILKNNGGGPKCFDENTHIVNVGIGLGGGRYLNYTFGDYVVTPIFDISYEQPWSQKIGPGYLGVGGYFAYRAARFRYDYTTPFYGNPNTNYYYESRWNYYTIAGRAAYHWDVLNSEKAELYAGVLIGARFQTYSYTDNDPSNDHYDRASGGPISSAFSAFAGARYYFTKNFGVYVEARAGVSYINAGCSFKF
jgi:hypothetical protein